MISRQAGLWYKLKPIIFQTSSSFTVATRHQVKFQSTYWIGSIYYLQQPLSLHCYYAPEGTYILNERNQTFPLTMPPLDGVIIKLKINPDLFQYKRFNWPAREFNIINKSKNISQEPPWAQLSSTIQWYWILRVHKCRLNVSYILMGATAECSVCSKPLSWRSS